MAAACAHVLDRTLGRALSPPDQGRRMCPRAEIIRSPSPTHTHTHTYSLEVVEGPPCTPPSTPTHTYARQGSCPCHAHRFVREVNAHRGRVAAIRSTRCSSDKYFLKNVWGRITGRPVTTQRVAWPPPPQAPWIGPHACHPMGMTRADRCARVPRTTAPRISHTQKIMSE